MTAMGHFARRNTGGAGNNLIYINVVENEKLRAPT
jgi:hypothetical protein